MAINTDVTGGLFNSLAGGAMGAATGNPIAIIGAVAGIGLSLFGGSEEAKAQKAEAEVSEQIAGYEQQINAQRQQLATDIYQRQSTENMRKAQQAGARSKAAATAQGAQFGSGAKAGEEQAGSEAAFNQQGLYQNYAIGQNIFGLTSQIDQAQIRLAQLGGQAAQGAGTAALGQGLTSGAMALGRLTGGFGAQG